MPPDHDQEPTWQPISMLPTIAAHIDEGLAETVEQLRLLRETEDKPYVLDDATVARVKRVYGEQAGDLWLYEEQLRRWHELDHLGSDRHAELDRLGTQLQTLKETNTTILELAETLEQGTIEKQLAKSDLQVGLETLLGTRLDPQNGKQTE